MSRLRPHVEAWRSGINQRFPERWAHIQISCPINLLYLVGAWLATWDVVEPKRRYPDRIEVSSHDPHQIQLFAIRDGIAAYQNIGREVADDPHGFIAAAESVINALDCRSGEPIETSGRPYLRERWG